MENKMKKSIDYQASLIQDKMDDAEDDAITRAFENDEEDPDYKDDEKPIKKKDGKK